METHPVTLLIGGFCTILLIVLVGLGLSCTAFSMEADKYPFFEKYYHLSKSKKVC